MIEILWDRDLAFCSKLGVAWAAIFIPSTKEWNIDVDSLSLVEDSKKLDQQVDRWEGQVMFYLDDAAYKWLGVGETGCGWRHSDVYVHTSAEGTV